MDDEYRNVATGYSTVGGQFGRTGDVTVNTAAAASDPIDVNTLRGELRELRRLLERAAGDGLVDAHLVPAAVASLDAADDAARLDGEVKRGRLLRALETLRAAVGGVAGISEAVASIIASLNGSR